MRVALLAVSVMIPVIAATVSGAVPIGMSSGHDVSIAPHAVSSTSKCPPTSCVGMISANVVEPELRRIPRSGAPSFGGASATAIAFTSTPFLRMRAPASGG